MAIKEFQNYQRFKEEDCDFCGLCFHKCPVLSLPLDFAKKEIESIVKNGTSKKVLSKCVGCMSCNHYCPNECDPYTLILQRWNEKYRKNGLPVRAQLAMPYDFPNLHSFIIENLPQDEKEWIKQYKQNIKNPEGKKTMIYASCNLLIQSYMYQSKLYEDQTIFGSTELCCGEPLYRAGCFEAFEQVAHHLKKDLEQIGFEKLIMPCLAGFNLFTNVYAEKFGVKFDFEIISIIDWLWDELHSGKYVITPLNLSATIHDSCWPKANGDYFFNKVRELVEFLGIKIVEAEHNCEDALCCGMSAAAAQYSVMPALKTAKIRIKEFKKTKADVIIDYCGGCNWLFSVASKFSLRKMPPLYTLMEIAQMAIGEMPLHRTKKRGILILKSILGKVIKSYLTRKRYYIDHIMDLAVEIPEKT